MRASNISLKAPSRLESGHNANRWTWAIHAVLLLLSLVVIFPLFWAIITSLKQPNEIYTVDIIAQHPTLDNYTGVYSAIPFLQMMLNTFIFAISVTVGVTTISVLAAYAFARWEFPGKNL